MKMGMAGPKSLNWRRILGFCMVGLGLATVASVIRCGYRLHIKGQDLAAWSNCHSLAAGLAAREEDGSGVAGGRLLGDRSAAGSPTMADLWGTPYRTSVVRRADGGIDASVVSAGRDKTFGTGDDISVQRSFGPPVNETDTELLPGGGGSRAAGDRDEMESTAKP